MSEVIEKIKADVQAALAAVERGDPVTAELVRLEIGPDTTWNEETVRLIPLRALQHTDGRAG